MGILHSIIRIFCCYKSANDEQNHNSESYVRMGCGSICKAIVHWFRSVFYSPRKQRDRHVPVLPIQIPASISRSNEEESGQRSGIPDLTSSVSASEEIVCSQVDVVVSEERWIKHYSSGHRILLVGEGDFSFSASLAVAFGSAASNIIATSLDSEAFLVRNYRRASSNIEKLRRRESRVMHEIDATQMANHPLLGHLKFDRIIFNFPFAGFFTNLTPESQLRRHRRLVSLFLKNAREMISEDGEIHITHKTNGTYHAEFKLEIIASFHRLTLIEAVSFNFMEYPGYNTKYGFGGDKNFNCNPSKTFKFGLKGVRTYPICASNSAHQVLM